MKARPTTARGRREVRPKVELRAVELRWKALREVELATPRSMALWVAFKAVFLNIAGFFRRFK